MHIGWREATKEADRDSPEENREQWKNLLKNKTYTFTFQTTDSKRLCFYKLFTPPFLPPPFFFQFIL